MQHVAPHLQWVEAMRPEEAAFLTDLPFTISVPSHRLLIVHAGLVPHRPKHRQHFLDMYQVFSLLYTGYFVAMAAFVDILLLFKIWAKCCMLLKSWFHTGHCCRMLLRPFQRSRGYSLNNIQVLTLACCVQ